MPDLDDADVFLRLDPSGMGSRIVAMPTLCRDAWVKAQAFPLPGSYAKAERVLVLGMGGSAIGGDLLADLQELTTGVPVEVHRGYGRGRPADDRTLIIASSYSGNTEETLSAFQHTWKRGSMAVACTSGGALATRCRMLGVPVFPISFQGEPRCAVGYSLFAMLGFLQRLGLAPDRSADVLEAVTIMDRCVADLGPDVPISRNPAKELALRAQGKAVMILGGQHLASVARRWKTQLAENAKTLAFYDTLPEWDHNTIEGLRFPVTAPSTLFWVLLESDLCSPRMRLRSSITKQIVTDAGFPCEGYVPQGKTALAQLMAAVLFGDYVSYYLAIANDIDPAPTPILDSFKTRMASP